MGKSPREWLNEFAPKQTQKIESFMSPKDPSILLHMKRMTGLRKRRATIARKRATRLS
jgi:hypothetical protein